MLMNPSNKNRLIFFILIFLVLVNLSALVTFFTYRSHYNEVVVCDAMQAECRNAFKSELGLSEEQSRKVEVINMNYQEASNPIVEKIRDIRSSILDELSAEQPDTSSLRQKSDELCNLQLQLQKANFTQYLALKKVCNPGQAQRLSALYRELYGCGRMGNGPGRMQRHMGWQK
jgi:Spy/CpxP family protein refolding chaperone